MQSKITIYIIALVMLAALSVADAQNQATSHNDAHKFTVTSTTFSNGGTLPLITVWNQCSFYAGGGNQSPELSWTHAPGNTRSFVVVAYDPTASFTHWGMYNISPHATGLPQNAGVPGSSFGQQVNNDYGVGDLSYDGPCPPPSLSPTTHHYVFTVYALDIVLPTLPTFGDFPPGSEALYHALLAAGKHGDILATASTDGFFPGSN
jgi:Raf kinase inhibitor-like YbhB/YbcL family protein